MTVNMEKKICILRYECDAILEEIRRTAPEQYNAVRAAADRFAAADQNADRLHIDRENGRISGEEKQKPRRNLFFGYASAGGGMGRGQTVYSVFTRTDALNRTEYGPEEAEEGTWGNVSPLRHEEALYQRETAAARLWDAVSAIPGMDRYLRGSADRVRLRKYQEAISLTPKARRGDDDFMRGMEYFARLGSFRDCAKRFAACNNALFALYSRAMLLLPLFAAFFTEFLYLSSFGMMNTIHSAGQGSYRTLASVAADGIPWALFFAAVAYGVGELVLMIVMLLRRGKMRTRRPYSGGEREWTILEE